MIPQILSVDATLINAIDSFIPILICRKIELFNKTDHPYYFAFDGDFFFDDLL